MAIAAVCFFVTLSGMFDFVRLLYYYFLYYDFRTSQEHLSCKNEDYPASHVGSAFPAAISVQHVGSLVH